MKKVLAPIALIAGVCLLGQGPAQAATDQDVLDRLAALENQAASGGNFIIPGKKNMHVKLYGQVNKAVMWTDDGKTDKVFFVDNDNSSSRIGLKAHSKLNDQLTAGAQFEVEYQNNDSNKVKMGTESINSGFNSRQIKVYLDTVAGKVTIGKQSTVSDGIAEIDLSGTKLAGSSYMYGVGGGFNFYDNTSQSYTTTDVHHIFDNLDGSRYQGVRYDSPTFVGITLSAAATADNQSDFGIRYSGAFNGTKVKAGLAYVRPGKDDFSQIAGSASVMLPFGLNFTVASGQRYFDDTNSTGAVRTPSYDDGTYYYGKVGYQMKAMSVGPTSFAVDYGSYDDMTGAAPTGTQYEGDTYGLMVSQKIKSINTDLYAAYRYYTIDDNQVTTDYEDISIIWGGCRVQF